MNKKWLSLIILFLCLSLAGIIVVQYLWIKNAMEIREAQFSQRVNDALGNAVIRLETNENMTLLSSRLISDSIRNLIKSLASDSATLAQSEIDADLLHAALNSYPFHIQEERIVRHDPKVRITAAERVRQQSDQRKQPTQQRHADEDRHQAYLLFERQQATLDSIMEQIQTDVILENEWVDIQFEWQSSQLEKLDSVWVIQEQYVQGFSNNTPNQARIRSLQRESERIRDKEKPTGSTKWVVTTKEDPGLRSNYYFTDRSVTPMIVVPPPPPTEQSREPSKILEDKIRKLDKRASQLQDLIQRMAVEFEEIPKTIESRIDKKLLENTLKSSFADKDITIPFEFAVFSPLNDSNPIPIRSAGYLDSHQAMNHMVSLFPNDVIEKPDQVSVYFPGQKNHILKSLSVLMFGSVLFTMIIVLSSGLSIFVILRQKKISDIKTDFINNMTHEFKTPIATISIAADSINNAKVIDSPDQIKSYTKIIKEENSRMNTRVEQVLQMSLLDSRDFKLHREAIDLQELIKRTVDHFKLIVEKRGGSIETRFDATNSLVSVDEGHMRNVIMNLLDNANKYSVAHPQILVKTGNRSGNFFFGVEDKGMGMTADVQKRVFDKFFRVTSGNVHNVKGFGLGLSYVKAIVLAHQGDIQLTSEPGKGSRFEISLPALTHHKS